ncbi:MAG: protein translocase subunit SecD [Alphaproteobacteria bacterium]|nr:protein translocase subunit SecD [Alphaproteobacteria bacterium]MBR1756555.1 protein translocase subunit SecD [Alphaproteobacteria bacterium]
MYKLSLQRILVIIAICLVGVFFAVPNVVTDKTNLPKWWQPVNLGLDLQGGSSLLLQVKMDDVLKDKMATLEDSVRQSLRRTRYQNLQSDKDGVSVKITDFKARDKAKEAFRKLDEGLVVEEDENGEGIVTIRYNEQALAQLQSRVIDQSVSIVRRRIDELGTKEPIVQGQGTDRVLVQLPGVQNPESVKILLGKTAKMSFHLVDESTTLAQAKRGKISKTSRVMSGSEGEQYVVIRKPVVGGENLTDARVSFQEGAPVVSFRFNTIGGRKFAEVTSAHVGERLAIVLDNEVISAPNIQTAITGGSGVITGNFTTKSANDLALLLRSGALPAPLEVLEERTVGAGLGADSIHDGVIASIVGFAAIVIFMILAYGLFGLMVDITLFLNLAIMLGAMSFIGTTLTLPGIAGIILTIGMAVDANILIFERIREEVNHGRSIRDAITVGFTEAYRTIVDSNLTTLVAGAVLFYFGSGPVRGFAVTLTIGILTSMFTSVTVSRLMVEGWLAKFKPTKLPL